MCNETQNQRYEEAWEDFFENVKSPMRRKFLFDEDVYMAFGAYHDFPVEDLRRWYRDAEKSYIPTDLSDFICAKYGVTPADDPLELIDRDIENGDVYENRGHWFENIY